MSFVFLNVNGTPFQARRDTLSDIPIFAAYFENASGASGASEAVPLFVDRDFGLFERVYLSVAFPNTDNDDNDFVSETQYYGFGTESGANTPSVEELATFETDVLLSDPAPYYVNACGKVFTTTRKRLSQVPHFQRIFDSSVVWKETSAGTLQNPLFLDIPACAFACILKYLRNAEQTVPPQYHGIMDVYGISRPPVPPVPSTEEHVIGRVPAMTAGANGGAFMVLATHDAPGGGVTWFTSNPPRVSLSAKERFTVAPDNNVDWGKLITFPCNRVGDLLQSAYLTFHITMPHYVNWKEHLAYRLIEYVEVLINGIRVDLRRGQAMWIEEQLFELCPWTSSNLTVPLRLFFTRRPWHSLPMGCMVYSNVQINVKLASLESCVHNGMNGIPNLIPTIGASLSLTHHFQNGDERRDHAKINGMVIQQHQYLDFDVDQREASLSLNRFNLDVEMLAFTLHNNDDEYQCLPSLISAELTVNGCILFHNDAFELLVIDKREANIRLPQVPVYTYNFGLDMLKSVHENQPSGHFNLSRVDTLKLNVKYQAGVKKIRVWAINRNILIFNGGVAALRYSE